MHNLFLLSLIPIGQAFLVSNSFSFGSGFQFDYVYDWTILKYQQSQIATPPPRAPVSNDMHDHLRPYQNICFMFNVISAYFSQGAGAGPSSGIPHAINSSGR